MTKILQLPLERIDVANSFQPRCETSEERAEAYADLLAEAGFEFPPIDVFFEGRQPYWMGDGFTRYRGHQLAGRRAILSRVHEGGQRDAMRFALAANATHGYPRSNADKRRVVLAVLDDAEWRGMKDREIARMCAVSQPFVSALRRLDDDNGYQRDGPDDSPPTPMTPTRMALRYLRKASEALKTTDRRDVLEAVEKVTVALYITRPTGACPACARPLMEANP